MSLFYARTIIIKSIHTRKTIKIPPITSMLAYICNHPHLAIVYTQTILRTAAAGRLIIYMCGGKTKQITLSISKKYFGAFTLRRKKFVSAATYKQIPRAQRKYK